MNQYYHLGIREELPISWSVTEPKFEPTPEPEPEPEPVTSIETSITEEDKKVVISSKKIIQYTLYILLLIIIGVGTWKLMDYLKHSESSTFSTTNS